MLQESPVVEYSPSPRLSPEEPLSGQQSRPVVALWIYITV